MALEPITGIGQLQDVAQGETLSGDITALTSLSAGLSPTLAGGITAQTSLGAGLSPTLSGEITAATALSAGLNVGGTDPARAYALGKQGYPDAVIADASGVNRATTRGHERRNDRRRRT